MFRALLELAERENLLSDPSYEPEPVDFFIHLGCNGKFLDLAAAPREAPSQDAKGKPKGIPKPPLRLIPRRSDRTSGDRAEFLVDKAEYVFGIDPGAESLSRSVTLAEARQSKLNKRRALFLDRIRMAANVLGGCENLRAVVTFLERDPPETVLQLFDNSALKPAELAGALFAFVYEPDGGDICVHEDVRVREYFRSSLEASQGRVRGQCLVTGEPDALLTRLHAKPKGVPPLSTTKGGVPFTTVNQESFRSYGLADRGGAPVSARANLAIDIALTRLLHRAYPGPDGLPLPQRNLMIGDSSVLVYWTRREASLEFLSGLENRDPEEVAGMLKSPHPTFSPPLQDPVEFFALILSGKQGRAIVRSFIQTTVRDVARNIERWRDESRINRPFGKGAGGFALHDLRSALAMRNESDDLPAALGAALYLAIVMGRSFPAALLETIVRRNRAQLLPPDRKGRPDSRPLAARSSLLKAWFIRNRGKEVPVSLDTERSEIAYRLGRLLATLDMLQADALGQVNTSIVDRFFGSASSTPAAVFPTLVRQGRNHLDTLRRDKPGLAVHRERLIQEIYSTIENFPKTLDLDDQGLFSIGFYHQRQDFFTRKEEPDDRSRREV